MAREREIKIIHSETWRGRRGRKSLRVMRRVRPFCPGGLGPKRTGLLGIDTSDVLPTERGDLCVSQQRHEFVFIVTQETGNMECGAWLCVLPWLGCSGLCSVGGSQLRAVCRSSLTSYSTILFSWRLYPPSICRRQKRSWQMCSRWRFSDKQ